MSSDGYPSWAIEVNIMFALPVVVILTSHFGWYLIYKFKQWYNMRKYGEYGK